MKKTLKIMIALLAVAALVLAFAACGKKADPEEDGQNPVMNFIGEYAADRCTITVEADGDTDAKISAHWGNSAFEAAEYTMSGYFDVDTLRVNYSDGVKKVVTYDANGEIAEEKTEYENGVGRIQFYDDGTLAWQDEQEADQLIGMVFTLILREDDAAPSDVPTTAPAGAADTARAALSEAIAGARAYYNEIKDNDALAQIADDLDTRLQRAEAILAASDSAEADLTGAAADVAAALEAAKDQAAYQKEGGADDGQNPVMNFIGQYAADRCTITIEADGDTDAKISVHWANSAFEAAEYTMGGYFDADTFRINYTDGVKKIVTYDENGSVVNETTEYTDGYGRIQFHNDGTLSWQDEKEADSLAGMTFTFLK